MTGAQATSPAGSRAGARRWVRLRVARLLELGTRLAFLIALTGVVITLVAGAEPGGPTPAPGPGSWLEALLALDPAALVWPAIGLTAILPAMTVVVAAVGYTRVGNRRAAMTAVAVLVALAATLVAAALGR